MSEDLKQMQDRHALLMAARYGAGHPRTGQRIYEVDGKYQREVFALAVQIEERKAAEASQPQISQTQLDQLAWLDRARGARDKNGNLLSQETSPKGTQYRKNIQAAHVKLLEGGDISASIAATESTAAAEGVKLGAPAHDQTAIRQQRSANGSGGVLPPATATHLGGGAITTNRGPK